MMVSSFLRYGFGRILDREKLRDKCLETGKISFLCRFPFLSDWKALVFCRLLQTVALKMLINRFIISLAVSFKGKVSQTKPNVHYS